MKKYLASDIINRALHLADLHNTDFLSHDELQEYINDTWKSLYQRLINKGDKQFIKEVQLSPSGIGNLTEYYIPDDCYQILSLKDMPSGRIVPRHTESESVASNTYEVVNDKIRLYGVTSHNLVLTYYVTPIHITFPDKTVYPTVTQSILSSARNSVLYADGSIYNLITGEHLGKITITAGYNYQLGNGHVVRFNNTSIQYLSYTGASLYSGTGTRISTLLGYDYKVYWQDYVNNQYSNVRMLDRSVLDSNGYRCIALLKQTPVFIDNNYHLIADGIYSEETYNTNFYPINNNTLLSYAQDQYHALTFEDKLYDVELDVRPVTTPVMLHYGLLTSNGTDHEIISWWPDTEFNFPNELFYSMISYALAQSFLAKQNASNPELDSEVEAIYNQYMDSLSQDGGYTRIKNIYRG